MSAVRELAGDVMAVRRHPLSPAVPRRARVVFDEAHSEAWTIRPELASAMQPAHPRDASYAMAAAILAAGDFAVEVNAGGPLTRELLRDALPRSAPPAARAAPAREAGTGA